VKAVYATVYSQTHARFSVIVLVLLAGCGIATAALW
jgi:hypothetical protein